jgi:hypothetical protein
MKPLSNGIEMNPTSKQEKSQQESAGRRGFLRKFGAAAGAVIVTAGVVHAAPAVSARRDELEALTPQQRLLLAQLNEMTDQAQKFIYDMAEFNARTFPREFPNVTVMPRGSV